MLTKDFAKTLRDKYPDGVSSDGIAYSTMSDEDLVGRVVQKYPVYKAQLEDFKGADANSNDNPLYSPVKDVKQFGSEVVTAVKEHATNLKNAIVPQDQKSAEEIVKGGQGRMLLRAGGQVGGLVGDIELSVLKLIAPKFAEDLAVKGIKSVASTDLAKNIMTKMDEFKQKHPQAAQDLEDTVNIAALIPYIKGPQKLAEEGGEAIQKVSKITNEAIDASRATRIANAGKEIDSVVGSIVQGKTDDILKAKKALSTIDTVGVKTYSELGTRLNDGVEALAGKVDDILEKEGKSIGALKPNQLVTATKVGSKTIKQNFVKDALDQLDELYTSVKDAPSKAGIAEIRTKLNTEGLSLKEVNDLSRTYGREFGGKAFSKMGDPLTSVNAQAFENTRKGIKNAVRNLMPNDTVKMLDQRMSDLYNTNRLVGKMEEKVGALYQKVQKRGLLEKIAMKTADVANAVTMNTVSGFVSRLLPSNVGLKVMNSIDLENALSKSLKKLNGLIRTSNDKLLEDQVVKIIRENVTKVK
jgi:hypothetical protein